MICKINNTSNDYEVPNICPHCHVTNMPDFIWGTHSRDKDNNKIVIAIWKCTNIECQRIIVVEHKQFDKSRYMISRILNGLPKGPAWPKPILELTSGDKDDKDQLTPSKFIETYLQSMKAENNGLDEIAGMGYRKAIEYLVKDWAIQKHPDKINEIKKQWLASVINDYYEGDLKEILERATWLGNDQGHYLKLFDKFNINNLKELIDLIMVELDREHKKKHYIENIQNKK